MQCIYLIFQFREDCLKIVCYRENIQVRIRHASTKQVLAYANSSSKVYSLLNSGLEKENQCH